VNLLLCTLRVMRMLALQSQKLGILMITSIQIISKDIKIFMCFFAIVVVPFVPFSSFFNYSFKSLVWAAFGEVDIVVDGDGGQLSFSGEVFLCVFVVLTTVVMTNLLVAMMSRTYEQVRWAAGGDTRQRVIVTLCSFAVLLHCLHCCIACIF
jgi:hypothetical protein